MEEARQILLLDFGDVPGDRPASLDYIQLTIGLLIESMITHILKIGGRRKVHGSSNKFTRKRHIHVKTQKQSLVIQLLA